ncbi:MAG: FumA C-terminus/TtdB family hydratase beta subunit [Methanobacteriaceae archaeon]
MEHILKTPLQPEETQKLRVKDKVYISGTIYTARDSAHQRMVKEGAPMDLEGAVIFHAGPIIQEEDGQYRMVAVGPTTSTRMNPYEAQVLDEGVKAIIGKGGMDQTVAKALIRNKAVFLSAVGGCAALYVQAVCRVKQVFWLDLGVPEAVWELEVENFGPLIVTMDSEGGDLYQEVRESRER